MRKLVDSRLSWLIAGSVCALVLGSTSTADAQRVIFPSPVSDGTAPMTAVAAPPSNVAAPVYTAQLQGGSPSAPAYSTPPTYTAPPTYAAPSTSPYAAPSAIAQPAPYGNPALPYNPAQPAAPFDPYGTAPPSLAPPTYTGPPPGYNDGFFPTAFRLLQEARFQHTYIARTGNQGTVNSFGLNDDELFLSFGFPICKSNAPL
ncbi:MAG TPA: hypothetical protein VHV77_02275, partial [Pirellulales bacterium]|nr:hypothetical protein [Pirellulales bacterium]